MGRTHSQADLRSRAAELCLNGTLSALAQIHRGPLWKHLRHPWLISMLLNVLASSIRLMQDPWASAQAC